MSRTRKPASRDPVRGGAPKGATVLTPARARMRPLFTTVDDITATADRALQTAHFRNESPEHFDAQLLLRGLNALKAAVILCEQSHWEIATAASRQLFELVLTAEDLERAESREAAVDTYVRFARLTMVRHAMTEARYRKSTGRLANEERLTKIDALLLSDQFKEFRVDTKKGIRWQDSWTKKTVRQRAAASEVSIRLAQYEGLYGPWSDQVHAAPSAVMQSLIVAEDGDIKKAAIKEDDRNIAETLGSAIALFLELWGRLPTAPDKDPEQHYDWLETARVWTYKHFDIVDEWADGMQE
jgi:hypothetical protein